MSKKSPIARTEIVERFCERTGRSEVLYRPKRCLRRLEAVAYSEDLTPGELIQNVLISVTRIEVCTRYRLLQNCVKLKIPYWREMRTQEMRAVLLLLAWHVQLPEVTFGK